MAHEWTGAGKNCHLCGEYVAGLSADNQPTGGHSQEGRRHAIVASLFIVFSWPISSAAAHV